MIETRSVLKDFISNNEKLQKAVEMVYKQLQAFSEADPILDFTGWFFYWLFLHPNLKQFHLSIFLQTPKPVKGNGALPKYSPNCGRGRGSIDKSYSSEKEEWGETIWPANRTDGSKAQMVERTLAKNGRTQGSVLKTNLKFKICFQDNVQYSCSFYFGICLIPFDLETPQVNPRKLKALKESWPVVHCQRVQHALDIFNTAGGFENSFINTSQSIARMVSVGQDAIPCLTPNGQYFSMRHKRYLTGLVCSKAVSVV